MSKRKEQPRPKRAKAITTKRVQADEDRPFVPPPHIDFKPEIDEDGWDEEGLTVKQRRFVENMIGPAAGNATKAAELAGYRSENRAALGVTAFEVLKNPKVREAIARRLARANLTPEWLRQMTGALAASNMGTFLSLKADGEPELDWRRAEALGAFVQIRKYKEKGMKVGGTIEVIERSIETHNPAPYLQLLARLLGLVKEHDGPGSVTVNVNTISEDDLIAIATGGRRGGVATSSGTGIARGLCERN